MAFMLVLSPNRADRVFADDRYFHMVYALDTVLCDLKRPDKAALENAMEGHILARAVLIGTYQKGP